MCRKRLAFRLEIIRQPRRCAEDDGAAGGCSYPRSGANLPRSPLFLVPTTLNISLRGCPSPGYTDYPHAANTVGATVRGGPLRACIANTAAASTNWAGASGTRLRKPCVAARAAATAARHPAAPAHCLPAPCCRWPASPLPWPWRPAWQPARLVRRASCHASVSLYVVPACHFSDGPHVLAMRCTCVSATFYAVVADTSPPPTLLFLAAALPEKFNNTGAPPFLQGEATWLQRMRHASPGTEPALCLSKWQRCAACHLPCHTPTGSIPG